MKTKITRKSKLGWNYNTGITQTENGWRIDSPDSPCHIGTIKQIFEKIENDANFQSLGGTYYSSAWFVKIKRKWYRITNMQDFYLLDRIVTKYPNNGYLVDMAEVEVERV